MKISLGRTKLLEALKTYTGENKPEIEKLLTTEIGLANTASFESEQVGKEFLQFILDNVIDLTDNQRTKVSLALHGVSLDTDAVLTKPSDVQTMIVNLKAKEDYNAEILLANRWYPVRLTSHLYRPDGYTPFSICSITAQMQIGDMERSQNFYATAPMFEDNDGKPVTMTGKQLFEKLKLRHLQTDLVEYKKKLALAAKIREDNEGKVMASIGPVLVLDTEGWFENFFTMDHGSDTVRKKVIVESSLESQNRTSYYGNDVRNGTLIPMLRLFSLDLKRFVYCDVEDIVPYKFDDDSLQRLVLPSDQRDTLFKLFHADINGMFGDILADKHGGMIILANGSTGTGKTLTAEVFSEITHRPLYVMEMAELGVDVNKIEAHLGKIFRRVMKWGAVLLMDEADIFLAERGENLERSVIVGIFLRLMDYYKGLLFLTSNRADKIDKAFKSRITIQLDYLDLDRDKRQQIWEIMLKEAGITLTDGLDGIPDVELNGRQIRNMVRLLKVLYGKAATAAQVLQVTRFAAK